MEDIDSDMGRVLIIETNGKWAWECMDAKCTEISHSGEKNSIIYLNVELRD